MKPKHQTTSNGLIRLNDVSSLSFIGNAGHLARARITRRGIEIFIPVSIPEIEKDALSRSTQMIEAIGICCIGLLPLFVSICMFLSGKCGDSDCFLTMLFLFSLSLLIEGLGIWGARTANKKREGTKGIVRMVIAPNTLTIISPNRNRRSYDIQRLRDFRLSPVNMRQQGKILVEYGAQTIGLCPEISVLEAQHLVSQLAMLLTFSCLTVERIIFGVAPNPRATRQTLQNPDVSTLTFTFVRLKQVLIYPETYDFHLVERFLTYAVNYVGQDYLKAHVEVCIYGEPEQFHPNLLNSFRNLCKCVRVG